MSVGGGPLGESKLLHLFAIAFDQIQFWMKVTASDHGRQNHSAADSTSLYWSMLVEMIRKSTL